jgi:tRNA A37 threonylcarbamoyladenosine modification protein TsaB
MRILAIDASTKASGFAVFEGQELTAHMRITASSSDLI